MKRLAIVFLFIFVALLACGQDVVYKDNPTLIFDHVEIGNDNFAWEVYAFDFTVGVVDEQDILLLTYIGETAIGEYVLTFPYSTDWAVGVRTKFTDDDLNVSYSAIAWSHNAGDADAVSGPFVYTPSYSPAKPDSLKDMGT